MILWDFISMFGLGSSHVCFRKICRETDFVLKLENEILIYLEFDFSDILFGFKWGVICLFSLNNLK